MEVVVSNEVVEAVTVSIGYSLSPEEYASVISLDAPAKGGLIYRSERSHASLDEAKRFCSQALQAWVEGGGMLMTYFVSKQPT